MFRKRTVRYRAGTRGRLIVVLAVLCGILLLGSYLLNSQLQPILSELAIAKVSIITLQAINQSVDEGITGGEINYDSIIYFEKDLNGGITALKTNMAEVSKLKTNLLTRIIDKISGTATSELSIPLGNLFGSNIFAGRGPGIPFKILSVGTANVNFENVFTTAGINQTRHQIMMNIEINLSVLLPRGTVNTVVNNQVCIAETVIVGTVPDNYTYFSDVPNSEQAAENYFKYAGD